MRKFILVLLVIFGLLLEVPSNYKDLDKQLLITTIIVDKDESNQYTVYYEGFSPTTSTSGMKQEGKRTILIAKSSNIDEIFNRSNSQSNLTLNFSQNRILLFTKEAASEGIDEFIGFFVSSEEFVIRNYIGIWDASAKEIEEINLTGEKFLGLYLLAQLNNSHTMVSDNFDVTIRKLYNSSSVGSKTVIVPIIKLIKNPVGDSLEIKCNGVVKDFKYEGEINTKDVITANILLNKAKSTVIETDNPESNNKKVLLRIDKSKTKTEYIYEDGTFKIKKNIKINAIYRGTQGKIVINDANIKNIEESAAKNFEFNCYKVFSENKEKNVDILEAQENFYRRYPKESKKIANILPNTILEVKANIAVELACDPKSLPIEQ